MNGLPSLAGVGWDAGWAAHLPGAEHDVEPGRVVRVDRGRCSVLTVDGALRATFSGHVLDSIAHDATATPVTGDWVTVRRWPDDPVTVESVLPRRTSVRRADVNGSSRAQVLAANLDVVAVVAALMPEPVLTKIERLVAVAWSSGARPVVVLTKADQVTDAAEVAHDVGDALPGVEVVVASVVTGEGVAALRATLGGTGTLGLLGASGVGKSSLANALVGAEVLATRDIRADGRGRHTSVRRELVPLPGGGALIDTPGLRGVGLIDAEDGLAATFDDIAELATRCRFGDCTHVSEPGCAVLAALEDGSLAVRRWESWCKLQRETERMAARTDARLRGDAVKRLKRQTKRERRTPRRGA